MTTETERLASIEDFLKDFYTHWYGEKTVKQLILQPILSLPKDVDWQGLRKDMNKSKFSKYIANPEVLKLTDKQIEAKFEQGKYIIFNPNTDNDFKNWLKQNNKGFTKASVMEYCSKKFKPINLPGLETHKWIHENQDKIPAGLKDGNWHYFLGTVLPGRCSDSWKSTCGSWEYPGWGRGADCLWVGWGSRGRILVFT